MSLPLLKSTVGKYPCKRGKVRDVYDIGDGTLVIVTTDRISAFDWVLPTPVPNKGCVLTRFTEFWLGRNSPLRVPYKHHMLSCSLKDMPTVFQDEIYDGRTMLVTKCKPVLIECVVRGYLCGSGWKDYKKTGEVCGHKLPAGLQENMSFVNPIFTPATKEESGHDINISIQEMKNRIGFEATDYLMKKSLEIFTQASEYAWSRGILIADTKFEWAEDDGDFVLIDEVLTPDSSRFWSIEDYCLGKSPPSFDKQYVRDYLESVKWDKNSSPPELPDEVVANTSAKYLEAQKRFIGE